MSLRAEGLGFRIRDRWLLRGVDLDLRPGEVLSVVGPNGAGKSTLVRALSVEIRPAEGQVLLDNRCITRWQGRYRGRRVAVLPQNSSPAFGFSALEVAMMGRIPHAGSTSTREDRRIALDCLQRVGVLHLANRSCLTLSGGEHRRVQLARILAQATDNAEGARGRYLLLDEPLASLDPAHQLELLHLLRRLAESMKLGVLIVMHDLNLAAGYSDRLLMLGEGLPRAIGAPVEVMNESLLGAVYGVRASVTRHPRRGCPQVMID